jgi:hypothetical protein
MIWQYQMNGGRNVAAVVARKKMLVLMVMVVMCM